MVDLVALVGLADLERDLVDLVALVDLVVPADHVRDLVFPADHQVPADLADLERDWVAQEVLDHMVVVVLAKVLTTDRLLADRFLAGEAEEVRHQFHQSRNQSF